MKLLMIFLFLAPGLHAATLECKTFINLGIVSTDRIVTIKKLKVPVGAVDEVTAFVAETADESFIVEAFLPTLQMRIYSEGRLSNFGDTLTASAWDRSIMVDVVCKKIK